MIVTNSLKIEEKKKKEPKKKKKERKLREDIKQRERNWEIKQLKMKSDQKLRLINKRQSSETIQDLGGRDIKIVNEDKKKSIKQNLKVEIAKKEISTPIYMFGTGQKFTIAKEKDKEGNIIIVAFVGRREPRVAILRSGIIASVNDTGTILTRSRNEKKKKERRTISEQIKYLNDMKAVRMSKVKFNKFSQCGMQGEQKAPDKPERKGKEKKKA